MRAIIVDQPGGPEQLRVGADVIVDFVGADYWQRNLDSLAEMQMWKTPGSTMSKSPLH
ncbi:MAG: hypothetical protein MAGBODY4_01423 [Candidatus Marinimicrobia bacterium]|nr:hypothetical protein [Candidatus Neomarinimicrobiota bacterium]